MPLYSYQIIEDDGSLGAIIEVAGKMSDPPLTVHPETGQKLQRVYVAPNVATRFNTGTTKKKLSDKNLDRLGFTKYQNEGGGVFRKTAGKGPGMIKRES